MNCATCKVNKIGPNTAPYGGYMCGNEHMQCRDCNATANGQCGLCEDGTNFVQMNYNNPSTTLTSPVPSAPPLETESYTGPSERTTSNIFPKDFFAHIETQSNISQEHLSMHESNVSDSIETSTQAQAQTQAQTQMQMQTQQQNQTQTQMQAQTQSQIQSQVPSQSQSQSLSQTQPQNQSQTKSDIKSPTLYEQLEQDSRKNSKRTLDVPKAQYIVANRQTSKPNPTAAVIPLARLATKTRRSAEFKSSALVFKDSKDSRGIIEDLEGSNIIHTSEIRFMESSESLKNYYSGGTVHPPLKSKTDHGQSSSPQEALSMKVLHDFESQNTAHPSELVENYLRSYGPLALCHFPAYSINHSCYHGGCDNWTTQQRQAQMRSICVSTESEPSLACNTAPVKLEMPPKYLPSEYFVMHATGITEPVPGVLPRNDKIERPSIDIRMQKVLETFHEDPRQPKVSEKPLIEQSKNFVKLPAPEIPTIPSPPPVEIAETEQTSINEQIEKMNLGIATRISNSHRAYYNPPTGHEISTRNGTAIQSPEPLPQFQLITCSTLVANDIVLARARFINMKPIPACQLNIPRAPIQCPESCCHRMIFVSDFNKHLVVDHNRLPMERISTRQCKNFFLDPRLSHNGVSRCHLLYLIRDKITDLGSGKFKDFLPLLVMSTRIKLSELCNIPESERAEATKSDVEFLMVWLTGIVPEEFPVHISLTVWPRSGPVPSCHIVHSGEMYSIRKPQSILDVWASGQMLLLSAPEVQMLTNGGTEMLELQVIVH